MNPRLLIRLLALAFLALALAVAGCGTKDPAALIASARSSLAKSDPRTAIIELKNALQVAPDHAEARFLLGQALFQTGDPVGAETEVRKALELKYSREEGVPLLARALLAQGEFQKITAEFTGQSLATDVAKADLAASLATAWLVEGNSKAASAAVDVALAAAPADRRALILRAQLLASTQDFPAAERLIDQVLAAHPDDVDAIAVKVELEWAQGKQDLALARLERAVATHPDAINLRFQRVTKLVTAKKADAAAAELEVLQKVAPGELRTVYAEALVALERGNAAKARELAQTLVGAQPNHLPSLYLLAVANYQLRSWGAAEDALRKVLAKAPREPGVRRLLAGTYLQSGRSAQALETLEPALRRAPNDPTLLRLAGEARLLSGDAVGAARLYEQAAAVDSANTSGQLRLAQIRFSAGDTGRALSDLERLADTDATRTQSDLALLSAHLQRRDFDRALGVVTALEKKRPNSGVPPELRGSILAAKRELAGARAAFVRSLELEPARLSAARQLALLDVRQGRWADARARYEKMLAADPNNDAILLALADTLLLAGQPASEVKATIERAIAADPKSARARLALVAHYYRQGDAKGALASAKEAEAAMREDPQLVEALGAAQLATGEVGQARNTFARLVQLQPDSPQPLLKLAQANIAQKDYVSAIEAQKRAIALQPDFLPAGIALAATYVVAGRPDDALAEARRLQRERPQLALGYSLEGEVLATQKRWIAAAAATREALSRQASPQLAAQYYALLAAAGQTTEAAAWAERWNKEHPKDATFRSLRAQLLRERKEYAAAANEYRAALEIEPENPVLLNNLAWLLNEMGRPEARDYAERAYQSAPLDPNVLDTLGWIALERGDTARALPVLRSAANLAPNDVGIRLRFAQALAKSGDKAAARREVESILRRDPPAPNRTEAERFLAGL